MSKYYCYYFDACEDAEGAIFKIQRTYCSAKHLTQSWQIWQNEGQDEKLDRLDTYETGNRMKNVEALDKMQTKSL